MAMELGPVAMAVHAREQEGERDSAERERASMKALWSSTSALEEQGRVARWWGAQLGHGRHA